MEKLIELTLDQQKALFIKNAWLKKQAENRAEEEADFWADEVLSYFRNVRGIRYSIGYCNYNYLEVDYNHYNDFLEALRDAQKDICILSDEEALILSRLENKIEFYRDCCSGYEDISDARFSHLEKWIEGNIKYLCDCIVKYISSSYDYYYSDEGAADALELLIDNIGTDYETDGIYIYELEVRKYA